MNQVLRQLGGKIRHFDGAMGTMLREGGCPGNPPSCGALPIGRRLCKSTGPIWRPGRIS